MMQGSLGETRGMAKDVGGNNGGRGGFGRTGGSPAGLGELMEDTGVGEVLAEDEAVSNQESEEACEVTYHNSHAAHLGNSPEAMGLRLRPKRPCVC